MYRKKERVVGLFVCFVLLGATACDGGGKEKKSPKQDTDRGAIPDIESDIPTYDGSADSGPPRDENCTTSDLPDFETKPFAGGHEFSKAVHMTQSPDDPDTHYVVEREGRIVIVRDGKVLQEPFLDISDQVVSGYGEQGLLGLAFHPNYKQNGRFFIDYTSNGESRNIVAEYHRDDQNPDKAEPNEVRRLVNIKDPKKQHNGGTLMFGPEGYLYASLGNGGAKEKRKHGGIGQAQYLKNVFGTIMRMDVDRKSENFSVPDNPFADKDGDGRIYAYGLRNPWRYDVDDKTGDLYIADVGKKTWEEVNFVGSESGGGQNFGWPAYLGPDEGPVKTAKKAVENHAEPIFAFGYRDGDAIIRNGCAIIGGELYRGDSIPELEGYYIYGDLCADDLAVLKYCDTADEDSEPELIDNKRLPKVKAAAKMRAIVTDNSGRIFLIGKKEILELKSAD